jgi:hypothetical protein
MNLELSFEKVATDGAQSQSHLAQRLRKIFVQFFGRGRASVLVPAQLLQIFISNTSTVLVIVAVVIGAVVIIVFHEHICGFFNAFTRYQVKGLALSDLEDRSFKLD